MSRDWGRRCTIGHAGGRGPVIRASKWFQKWAPERAPSSGFSLPPDDEQEFRRGRGKRVNRPPLPRVTHTFPGLSDHFAKSPLSSRRQPAGARMRYTAALPPNLSGAIRTCLIVRWLTPACDIANCCLYSEVSCCDNCDRPTIEPCISRSVDDISSAT